jgi:hypothetical protein
MLADVEPFLVSAHVAHARRRFETGRRSRKHIDGFLSLTKALVHDGEGFGLDLRPHRFAGGSQLVFDPLHRAEQPGPAPAAGWKASRSQAREHDHRLGP